MEFVPEKQKHDDLWRDQRMRMGFPYTHLNLVKLLNTTPIPILQSIVVLRRMEKPARDVWYYVWNYDTKQFVANNEKLLHFNTTARISEVVEINNATVSWVNGVDYYLAQFGFIYLDKFWKPFKPYLVFATNAAVEVIHDTFERYHRGGGTPVPLQTFQEFEMKPLLPSTVRITHANEFMREIARIYPLRFGKLGLNIEYKKPGKRQTLQPWEEATHDPNTVYEMPMVSEPEIGGVPPRVRPFVQIEISKQEQAYFKAGPRYPDRPLAIRHPLQEYVSVGADLEKAIQGLPLWLLQFLVARKGPATEETEDRIVLYNRILKKFARSGPGPLVNFRWELKIRDPLAYDPLTDLLRRSRFLIIKEYVCTVARLPAQENFFKMVTSGAVPSDSRTPLDESMYLETDKLRVKNWRHFLRVWERRTPYDLAFFEVPFLAPDPHDTRDGTPESEKLGKARKPDLIPSAKIEAKVETTTTMSAPTDSLDEFGDPIIPVSEDDTPAPYVGSVPLTATPPARLGEKRAHERAPDERGFRGRSAEPKDEKPIISAPAPSSLIRAPLKLTLPSTATSSSSRIRMSSKRVGAAPRPTFSRGSDGQILRNLADGTTKPITGPIADRLKETNTWARYQVKMDATIPLKTRWYHEGTLHPKKSDPRYWQIVRDHQHQLNRAIAEALLRNPSLLKRGEKERFEKIIMGGARPRLSDSTRDAIRRARRQSNLAALQSVAATVTGPERAKLDATIKQMQTTLSKPLRPLKSKAEKKYMYVPPPSSDGPRGGNWW